MRDRSAIGEETSGTGDPSSSESYIIHACFPSHSSSHRPPSRSLYHSNKLRVASMDTRSSASSLPLTRDQRETTSKWRTIWLTIVLVLYHYLELGQCVVGEQKDVRLYRAFLKRDEIPHPWRSSTS